jgi:transcriptional regulator with XRE-family HTH domain
MNHNDPKLFKDTFWNNERVKRNLKLGDIAKYLNVPYFTVGTWFCGKAVPRDEANIRKLCEWFSEMSPDDPISFDDGRRHFRIARLTWQAEHDLTLKAHGTDQDDEGGKFMGGKKNRVTEVGKFIKDRGVKHKDLAEKLNVPPYKISQWVTGRYFPNSDYIYLMAQELNTDADILSDMFLKAYNDYHNVEGQKTITDEIIESHEEPEDADISMSSEIEPEDVDNSMSSEIEKALDDRIRFVKWSKLYNESLFARIDIVAHLMHLYVEWDYNMWNAIEALAQERNDIPFWVLRKLILEAERVNYFGEISDLEDYIDE